MKSTTMTDIHSKGTQYNFKNRNVCVVYFLISIIFWKLLVSLIAMASVGKKSES